MCSHKWLLIWSLAILPFLPHGNAAATDKTVEGIVEEMIEEKRQRFAEEKRGNVIRDLVRTATFTVEASATFFPQTFPSTPRVVDDQAVVAWSKGTMKSRGDLTDNLSLKLALYALYSGYDDELRGTFASPDNEQVSARYVDVKECSLRYDRGTLALTLGRAPITVGLSTLYSPTNRYRVINMANPMHPDDLGAWQASLDQFIGDNTLRFTVLPFEERSPAPFGSSRWFVDSGGSAASLSLGALGIGGATGLTAPQNATTQEVFRNRPGYLVKFSGVSTGYDSFVTAHYGPSNFPVLQNTSGLQFIKEAPTAMTFSGGVAATRGALELHGESLYQVTDGDDDEDFIKYVLGATYREVALAQRIGLKEIASVIEYAGEWVTDEQDNLGLSIDSADARPLRNSLLFKIDVKPTDKVTCVLIGIRNFSSDDYAHTFGIEYRRNDNLTFKGYAVVFGGREGTPFGDWDRNDLFEFGVTRTF